MRRAFVLFVFLQLLDFGTTVVALVLGGGEENPLVRQFMTVGPLEGLAAAKLAALVLGAACVVSKRYKALRLANLAYTGIAVWNAGIIVTLMA